MSRLFAATVLLLVLACCLVLVLSSNRYRQAQPPPGQRLPMTFAHADHRQQQCVACHHNYQDNSGQGLCLDCHYTRQTLAWRVEQQFHALCMGCHLEAARNGEAAGPLRRCQLCHTVDTAP